MIASPSRVFRSATDFIHTSELRQFTQSKVQNSINTALPRKFARVSGLLLSHSACEECVNSGAVCGGAACKRTSTAELARVTAAMRIRDFIAISVPLSAVDPE